MKIPLLLILASTVITAPAATYYVSPTGSGSNPGTQAQPWDLPKANLSLQAGDTALLRGGTYSGQKVDPANNGAAGSYITYKAYTGETPVITAPPSTTLSDGTSWTSAIVVDGKHHIWIEGLKISGSSTPLDDGWSANMRAWARIMASTYVVLEGNTFEFAQQGIQLVNSRYCIVRNNTGKVLGKKPGQPHDLVRGDLMGVSQDSDHNLIENNDFRFAGHNIFQIRGSYNVIRGNYFNNNWGLWRMALS